jgi:hypothetical protein
MTARSVERTGVEVQSSAYLSADGVYRYSLLRWWDNENPVRDAWVMLNPSTADHAVNDPTVVRCIGFCRSFGSGGFWVGNQQAYRATKPKAMWDARKRGIDIIGPENDGWLIAHAMRAVETGGKVIVAWGANAETQRTWKVCKILRDYPLWCIGTTKDGQPRHPLMVRGDAQLEPWRLS